MPPPLTPAQRSALQALYDEADALLDGWRCESTAECCRFGLTGREPYVTSVEAAALEQALRALGRSVSSGARGQALGGAGSGRPANERACPFLGPQLRCAVYDARPLGCRTYFCHRAEPAGARVPHARWRELVRRLEDLARAHQAGGEVGRPITRVFGGGRPSGR